MEKREIKMTYAGNYAAHDLCLLCMCMYVYVVWCGVVWGMIRSSLLLVR